MSDAEVRQFEALVIPNEALERGGVEILRASIIDSELHVTLRRAFEQPDHWGGLLSELVRRIARAYAADGKMKEQAVVVRIRSSFVDSENPKAAKSRIKSKAKSKTKTKPNAKAKTKAKAKAKTKEKEKRKPAKKAAHRRKER